VAKNFDPRYNPAFQPGFDDGDATAERRPGVEPVSVRRAPEVEAAAARPIVDRADARPVVVPVETRPPLLASQPLIETHRNPWMLALWIVTAVFVVGGVAAQFAAQSLLQGSYVGSAIDYYVLPAVISQLAPWFTLAGLFAGVAAMVLSAIRWRPDDE